MKKTAKIAVLLAVGLLLSFTGCETDVAENGDDLDRFFAPTFRNNNQGSVDVMNFTGFDMLLFVGETLHVNNIWGGVEADSSSTLNVSTRNDYQVGGFTLLRAVRRQEFAYNRANSRVDHTVMLTYRQGVRSTADIRSTTDGNFQITVNNHSTQFALQLRENSPQGTVLAFLNAGELHRIINFSDQTMRTLFPVWVAYNTRTRSIVTSIPTGDPMEAQSLIPVSPAAATQPILSFPYPGAVSGEFSVDLPFATVRVQNNTGILLQLRNALAQIRTTSGLQAVNQGTWDVFEINPPAVGGLNLNLANGAGTLSWDVRFDGSNAQPVLQRGYEYLIVLDSTVTGTIATITQVAEIDTSDFLVTN